MLGDVRVDVRRLVRDVLRRAEGQKKILVYRTFVPNFYRLALGEADYAGYAPVRVAWEQEIEELLAGRIQARGLKLLTPGVRVELIQDSSIPARSFRVEALYVRELPLREGGTPAGLRTREFPGQGSDAGGEKRDSSPSRPPGAWLVVKAGQVTPAEFSLERRETLIGRDPQAQVRIPAHLRVVSRRHALVIREDGGGYRLRDLGSRNGTRLNGKVVREAGLRAGDAIRIGPVTLAFRIEG